jgi:hypothetical protein
VIALTLTLLALGGDPSVHPWPIGPGPQYRPPAQRLDGRPVGVLRCSSHRSVFQAHVEVFVNRRVMIVPSGIGRSAAQCDYPIRTRSPIGVLDVARGQRMTIGDLFRLWGQPLARHRIASFHSKLPVRAYVAGKLVRGDAARVRLTPKAQIVVELGAYVPPHRSFLFPPEKP